MNINIIDVAIRLVTDVKFNEFTLTNTVNDSNGIKKHILLGFN